MNRLGKILTLGLEKKRLWQLPIIAGLLALFAGGIWWYANWLGAGCFDVRNLVDLNNTEDLAYVLRWRPGRAYAKDEDEMTPLHMAARYGPPEVVKVLLKAGAEVNAKDNIGDTPLHWAAIYGHSKVVKILLKAEANVNAKDNIGNTPLHRAAQRGQTETAKVLLTAGAEVNAKTDYGRTPLDFARTEEMRGILRKHGAKTGAELDAEAKQGNPER